MAQKNLDPEHTPLRNVSSELRAKYEMQEMMPTPENDTRDNGRTKKKTHKIWIDMTLTHENTIHNNTHTH